jgi:imidazolonepropionase-like amidohydrolase
MVDCHMHMVLDGAYWKSAIARHSEKPDILWIRQVLETYRDRGFTYLRDCGDRWGAGETARKLAPEYGVEYRTPLASLYKKGHYGGIIGLPFETCGEFAALVRENREKGADFIKIMISGLMDFDHFGVLTEEGLPAEEIRELIHIAHEEGMAVSVHGNGSANVLAAAQAGVDSVEHGAYLNEETLQAMVDSGTVWVPTLSTIGNLRGKGRFSEPDVEKILASALENVAAFADMGGLLAPGSDAGAWQVPHGIETEYTLLAQALGEGTASLLDAGTAAIRQKFRK